MRFFITYLILVSPLYLIAQNIVINEVVSKNDTLLYDWQGDTPDFIELHNPTINPISLDGYFLSDNANDLQKWKCPNQTMPSGSYLIIYASGKDTIIPELHTNFKLEQAGEHLTLFKNGQGIISELDLPCIPNNHSITLATSGFYDLNNTVTPNAINDPNGTYSLPQDSLIWTHDAGFYSTGLVLNVSSLLGHDVKLTVSGEKPTPAQTSFSGPITLSSGGSTPLSYIPNSTEWEQPEGTIFKANIVSALSVFNGCIASEEDKRTFIIDDNPDHYPEVISLSFDHKKFFGENGIYVPGETGKNFLMRGNDWEKTVHLEYFNAAHENTFNTFLGARIHGGGSRFGPQKSMKFYFRSEYGLDTASNFGLKERPDLEWLKRFMLRGTTSDFTQSIVRDHLYSAMLAGSGLEYQASKPVIVFFNGEYWGIHYIKERQDQHYIAHHNLIDSDHINIVENTGEPSEGDNISFTNLMNFVRYEDLSNDLVYDSLLNLVDIDNLIDYHLISMYASNWDWPHNNIKLWSSDVDHKRFRYLFYDCDACFYVSAKDYFDIFKEEEGNDYILLKSLLKQDRFKQKMQFRAYQLLQTMFHPDTLIRKINEIEASLEPYISEHIRRWHQPKSYYTWQNDIDEIRYFAMVRPGNFLNQLDEHLGIDFTVYPNPANHQLFLPEPLQNETIQYTIMDLMGRNISKGGLSSYTYIDISDIPQGSYVITIYWGGLTLSTKFIKMP